MIRITVISRRVSIAGTQPISVSGLIIRMMNYWKTNLWFRESKTNRSFDEYKRASVRRRRTPSTLIIQSPVTLVQPYANAAALLENGCSRETRLVPHDENQETLISIAISDADAFTSFVFAREIERTNARTEWNSIREYLSNRSR